MTNTKSKSSDLQVNATTKIRFAEKQPKADIVESRATEKFGEIQSDEKSESWAGSERWNSDREGSALVGCWVAKCR
jgi:hypothetical protein